MVFGQRLHTQAITQLVARLRLDQGWQGGVPTRFLLIAQECQSPSPKEQISASYVDGDIIVESGRGGVHQLLKQLARQGNALASGDTIKIHDLSCLPVNTMSLVRIFHKLLQKGIAIEIGNAALVISPDDGKSELMRLIALLDQHWRHLHGVKSHPPDQSKPGPKPRLNPEQLTDIQARLSQPGATVSSVARDMNVRRTTLFDFLRRYS
ncbi:Hin recombinase [Sphingobium sp. DEHP117]|uniref:Hin recombinase n=1 Tax=Sphingobium sp. DEHP117 TaxID=2993436 RepID=UPI0027D6CCF2|nr:Hin recombinase [Sphingobium sp. DEHP117]MDQ4422180.1 Hin recombinase [Sphingobium sp. DEHP117]